MKNIKNQILVAKMQSKSINTLIKSYSDLGLVDINKKVLKKDIKSFLVEKLSTDYVWAKQALLRIYEYQTKEEQMSQHTYEDNGVGFSGAHSEILSSFATQVLNGRELSEKQKVYLFKYIKRYWKQLQFISDMNMLEKYVKIWIIDKQYEVV